MQDAVTILRRLVPANLVVAAYRTDGVLDVFAEYRPALGSDNAQRPGMARCRGKARRVVTSPATREVGRLGRLGRLLIDAKRGIKHGGWLPFLEKLGIADRTAREWMQEAGHIETISAEIGMPPICRSPRTLVWPLASTAARASETRSRMPPPTLADKFPANYALIMISGRN